MGCIEYSIQVTPHFVHPRMRGVALGGCKHMSWISSTRPASLRGSPCTVTNFPRFAAGRVSSFSDPNLAHLDSVNEFSQSVSSVQLFMYSAQEGDSAQEGAQSACRHSTLKLRARRRVSGAFLAVFGNKEYISTDFP